MVLTYTYNTSILVLTQQFVPSNCHTWFFSTAFSITRLLILTFVLNSGRHNGRQNVSSSEVWMPEWYFTFEYSWIKQNSLYNKMHKIYGDNIHSTLQDELNKNSTFTIQCHRNCVSNYTSSERIERHIKRQGKDTDLSSNQPNEYEDQNLPLSLLNIAFSVAINVLLRRSKASCSLSGQPYAGLPAMRVMERHSNKESWDMWYVNDEWASQVRKGWGAVSDMHAADGRYYVDCMTKFMKVTNSVMTWKGTTETTKCRQCTKNDDSCSKWKLDPSVELHWIVCIGHRRHPVYQKQLTEKQRKYCRSCQWYQVFIFRQTVLQTWQNIATIFIGNIVTGIFTNTPTTLQIALGFYSRSPRTSFTNYMNSASPALMMKFYA